MMFMVIFKKDFLDLVLGQPLVHFLVHLLVSSRHFLEGPGGQVAVELIGCILPGQDEWRL